MPDTGVYVRSDAGEGGVAGPVAVAGRGRVGDAPVRPARMVAELGTNLAGPVTQGDHVVEPVAGERVQGPGELSGDVDAELVVQHSNRVGVQSRLGVDSGADRLDAAGGVAAQQGFGDR